jgi:hypothetical protein
MTTQDLDQAKVETFGGQLIGVFTGAGLNLLISVGHQTGLFEALAGLPPATFAAMFERLTNALRPDGVVCGQCFGVSNRWNTPESTLTFGTRSQVETLLRGRHLLDCQVEAVDQPSVAGPLKHWHDFHVITQRTGRDG